MDKTIDIMSLVKEVTIVAGRTTEEAEYLAAAMRNMDLDNAY